MSRPHAKVWEGFFSLKNGFHGTKNIFGQSKFIGGGGGLFCMGSNYQIKQGEKIFTNAISGNLNSVNLKCFHGHSGKHLK